MIPFTLGHHPSNDGRIGQLPNLLPELWKYSGNEAVERVCVKYVTGKRCELSSAGACVKDRSHNQLAF
jgi:hypothetical protein